MSRKDPFDRLVEGIIVGGGHHPVWGQHSPATGWRFDERRFRKALYAYWGAAADTMRVSLAVQDASFVAGVMKTVSEQLRLGDDDRRRAATAVLRRRLLGEPDPTLDEVDAAWTRWWPPATGDEGRTRFAEFLDAWRAWLGSNRDN